MWKFLIRIIVGITLIAYLLTKQEVGASLVMERIFDIPLVILVGALALYLLGQLLCSYRWAVLACLTGYKTDFMRIWPIYFSGMFFNICLPTSIGGDVVRVIGLSRQTGNKSVALASVFMDRNVGLAALLMIGLIASLISCFSLPVTLEATLWKYHFIMPIWPLFVCLLAGYVAVNISLFNQWLNNLAMRAIDAIKLNFINAKFKKIHNSLYAYRQPLSVYLLTFILSLLYQVSEIVVVWLLAYGMNLRLSPWVFFALVPFQAIATLLPVTFNGMGVREGIFCAIIMGQFELALKHDIKDEALALSLLFFSVILISSMIGGVVYLISGVTKPTEAEILETTIVAEGGH